MSSINPQTKIVVEEIIEPGMSSFRDLEMADVILEVDDIVRCSSGGVGLDLALELLKDVDWIHVMEVIERKKNSKFNFNI